MPGKMLILAERRVIGSVFLNISSGDKATEMRTGWPEWKIGVFERLIEASGKRFDDLMYPNQDGILRGDYKGNR